MATNTEPQISQPEASNEGSQQSSVVEQQSSGVGTGYATALSGTLDKVVLTQPQGLSESLLVVPVADVGSLPACVIAPAVEASVESPVVN